MAAVEFQDRCLKPLGHQSKLLTYFVFSTADLSSDGHCYRICYRTASTRIGRQFSEPERGVYLGRGLFLHDPAASARSLDAPRPAEVASRGRAEGRGTAHAGSPSADRPAA